MGVANRPHPKFCECITGNVSNIIGLLTMKFLEDMCINKRNIEKKANCLISELRTGGPTDKASHRSASHL